MLKAGSMTLLTFAMLLSAAVRADDAELPEAAVEQRTVPAPSAVTLLAVAAHAPRWQAFHPQDVMTHTAEWLPPIADFHFHDDSALARLSKLRGLSLLTLAEYRQARLFLGINNEGLVGLHFGAYSRHGDERYHELVRMPYLNRNEPGAAVEQ